VLGGSARAGPSEPRPAHPLGASCRDAVAPHSSPRPPAHPASGRIVTDLFADVGEPSAGLYGVFAAQPGGGSVAGIALTREPLLADLMQAIARDLAAPTTGFIVLGVQPDGALPIRFFGLKDGGDPDGADADDPWKPIDPRDVEGGEDPII
jgi:hypothetical protein